MASAPTSSTGRQPSFALKPTPRPLDPAEDLVQPPGTSPEQEPKLMTDSSTPRGTEDDNQARATANMDPTTTSPDSDVMSGFPLVAILVGICVGSFLMSLDVFIIATAIPSITADFRDTSQIAWYPAAYSLTTCAIIPLAGKMASLFPLQWVYQGFFGIFLIGSIICGAANSSNMFIVGRAVAGVGASGVASGGLTIVLSVSTPAKRPLYMGLASSMFALGIILAPIIGGAFTERATWRWCFFVNLPAGAITLASMFFFFKPRAIHAEQTIAEKLKRLDFIGSLLFVPACFMILMAMQWGGVKRPWSSATIIGLFVGGGILVLVFSAWEWRMGDRAVIPGMVLGRRNVVLSCIFAFCQLGSLAIMSYYLPEWFQAVRGVSPLNSGIRVLPSVIAQIFGLGVVGVVAMKLEYYNPWFLISATFMSIAAGLFTTFTPFDTTTKEWIGYQVIQGLGVGLSMQVPMLVIQQDLESTSMIPIGVSLGLFSQYLGATVSQVIAGSIFNTLLKSSLEDQGLTARQIDMLLKGGTVNVRHTTDGAFPELLDPVLEAFNFAITRVYFVPVVLCCMAFFFALGLRWVKIDVGEGTPSNANLDEEAQTKDSGQPSR